MASAADQDRIRTADEEAAVAALAADVAGAVMDGGQGRREKTYRRREKAAARERGEVAPVRCELVRAYTHAAKHHWQTAVEDAVVKVQRWARFRAWTLQAAEVRRTFRIDRARARRREDRMREGIVVDEITAAESLGRDAIGEQAGLESSAMRDQFVSDCRKSIVDTEALRRRNALDIAWYHSCTTAIHDERREILEIQEIASRRAVALQAAHGAHVLMLYRIVALSVDEKHRTLTLSAWRLGQEDEQFLEQQQADRAAAAMAQRHADHRRGVECDESVARQRLEAACLRVMQMLAARGRSNLRHFRGEDPEGAALSKLQRLHRRCLAPTPPSGGGSPSSSRRETPRPPPPMPQRRTPGSSSTTPQASRPHSAAAAAAVGSAKSSVSPSHSSTAGGSPTSARSTPSLAGSRSSHGSRTDPATPRIPRRPPSSSGGVGGKANGRRSTSSSRHQAKGRPL